MRPLAAVRPRSVIRVAAPLSQRLYENCALGRSSATAEADGLASVWPFADANESFGGSQK